MKHFIFKHLYTLLICLAYPWAKKRLAKETKTPEEWAQRAGKLADFTGKEVIWLHCASVGEVNAALPLANGLVEAYPTKQLVVTTMTATGAARVKQSLPQAIHIFLPLDLPWRVRRFLTQLNPQVGIIMETEIWPNLLFASQKLGIKLLQANARITPNAFAGYLKLKSLISPALNGLTFLAAKSPEDKQRFLDLGLNPEKASTAGNIKYDLELGSDYYQRVEATKANLLAKGLPLKERTLWLAASTHDNEEAQLLEVCKNLTGLAKPSLLILAPRHPERFNQVAELLAATGVKYVRHSNSTASQADLQEAEVYLLDTLGELLNFYPLASLAFVGGSLVPKGGHNVLEGAALGVPVITGPYTEDFAEIINDLMQVEALTQVATTEELSQAVAGLLTNENLAQQKLEAGLKLVAANKGSLAKHLSLVHQLLRKTS